MIEKGNKVGSIAGKGNKYEIFSFVRFAYWTEVDEQGSS